MSIADVIGTLDAANGVGEGPTWDERNGVLWWTDIPGHRVQRLTLATLGIERWTLRDFPAFTALTAAGGLIVGTRDVIVRFDPATGAATPLARLEPERPDNRTNEGKVDPKGRLWVGTMQNNLNPDGSDRAMTASTGALYRIDADGRFSRQLDGVGLSNTLAWSPDAATMYFGDSKANRIRRYRLDGGGAIVADADFHGEPPAGICDGSAIDAEGYLWNARFGGGRLVRFAPDGRIDAEIALPVRNPTSCAFGGADFRTLFVTSANYGLPADMRGDARQGALVILRTGVSGLPAARFAG